MPDMEQDADSQDLAEIFDETNTTWDGIDIAHPDMAPDVYDVTAAGDDADEDQPTDQDDFNVDDLDEEDLERMFEADDGVDGERTLRRDDTEVIAADDDSPADFQAGGGQAGGRRAE